MIQNLGALSIPFQCSIGRYISECPYPSSQTLDFVGEMR